MWTILGMQRRDLIKLNQFIKVVQQPLPYNLRLNTHAVYSKAQQKAVASLVTGNGYVRNAPIALHGLENINAEQFLQPVCRTMLHTQGYCDNVFIPEFRLNHSVRPVVAGSKSGVQQGQALHTR